MKKFLVLALVLASSSLAWSAVDEMNSIENNSAVSLIKKFVELKYTNCKLDFQLEGCEALAGSSSLHSESSCTFQIVDDCKEAMGVIAGKYTSIKLNFPNHTSQSGIYDVSVTAAQIFPK